MAKESQNFEWHRIGERDEIVKRAPFAMRVEEFSIALFNHGNKLWAISNTCNHKGGPLSEGIVKGEYVTCPWHGWEYSIKNGQGPKGYEEECVNSFLIEDRDDGVYVATPPVHRKKLVKHKPHHLIHEHPKPSGAPPRVLGISTTIVDPNLPRFSTSEHLLNHALAHAAAAHNADTKLIRLGSLNFKECEGNYSKAARACTWPCAITERMAEDQMVQVYEGLVHWADVVIIATPIRWGSASSLYYKMAERLNCVQNQITIANNALIQKKVATFIITGGQDNIQHVAGELLTFFSELGFIFPPFPFVAHSRGWSAEDMRRNVEVVKKSGSLLDGAAALIDRAMGLSSILLATKSEMGTEHLERAGRKANPMEKI